MRHNKRIFVVAFTLVGSLIGFSFLVYHRSENRNDERNLDYSLPVAGNSTIHTERNHTNKNKKDSLGESAIILTDEEKEAKPEGIDLGYWTILVSEHRKQAKQNGDVEFYGRFEDQDGNPLKGVEIHVRVTGAEPSIAKVMEEERQLRTVRLQVTTDEDGRFEVRNLIGTVVTLDYVKLEGYFMRIEENRTSFSFVPEGVYSVHKGPRHEADIESPVIFRMTKKQ